MLRRGMMLAGALLLSGCAFGPQLSQVAVDHNRMVARSTDELTLLNIVRASHRFPLHFTAITAVNGDVSLNAGVDLSLGLDPVVDPQSSAPSAGISTSPNYQATVLATEQFQRGIQTPLSPETVAYYLDEGWRDGLLMALAVERVEVTTANGASRSIVNEAEATSEFARLLCQVDLVSVPSAASVPLARFSQLIDLDALAACDTTPAARRGEIGALLALIANDRVQLNGDVLVLKGSTNRVDMRPRTQSRCSDVPLDPALAGATFRPRFRSTLGVIFFLGEYQRLRAEQGPAATYAIPHCGESCRNGTAAPEQRPLVAILEGSGPALLATEFEGTRYYIAQSEMAGYAGDRGDLARSMQVLAFVEQLVNLQKSADQLPTSLNVTSVN